MSRGREQRRKRQEARGALRLRSVPQGAGLEARGEEGCGIGANGKRSAGLEAEGKGREGCGIGAKGKRGASLEGGGKGEEGIAQSAVSICCLVSVFIMNQILLVSQMFSSKNRCMSSLLGSSSWYLETNRLLSMPG
jgi:hypothetical protein